MQFNLASNTVHNLHLYTVQFIDGLVSAGDTAFLSHRLSAVADNSPPASPL
jgi:hypothetical protein